ncbi:MAG: PAS domain S-box protein [Deltaproteobacteria bacterium]|nr:PAS domain S-box protein [Deltaproteobacteria bacterium]
MFGSEYTDVNPAVFHMSPAGMLLRANAVFTEILGYSSDDIEGMVFSDIAANFKNIDREKLESIKAFTLFYFNRCEDEALPLKLIDREGNKLAVLFRSSFVRDENCNIIEGVGHFVPENDQYAGAAAPEVLDASIWEPEQLCRSVMQNSADAIVVMDFNGWIVSVNSAFMKTFGYADESEFVGKYLLEHIPMEGTFETTTGKMFTVDDDYYARQVEVTERLFETGRVKSHGYILRKDNKAVPVETSMSLLRDASGRHCGTISICRDATERELVEQALKESEQRFRTLFECAPDAYYLSDIQGNFIDGNHAAEQLIGFKKAELLGKNYFDLEIMSPDQFDLAYGLLAQNIAGQPTGPDEFMLHTKHRQKIWVEISTLPVVISGSQTVLGIAHDITSRKNIELQLQQARDELEGKVAERTLSLDEANAALRVLLKQVQQEKEMVEKNVAENVHDLIMPYIDKLKACGLNSQQASYVGIVESNLLDIAATLMQRHVLEKLSPVESRIANLIKNGKKSSDISVLLNISKKTVDCHRNSIREKVGIKNMKTNLRTFLLSLE